VKSAYKKETVWAAEIGTKNDFFGKKLRLNVAGYYYWYDDYQFTAEDPIPYGGGTANIPKAEIYGLEFEGMWAATRHLKFDGTLALADGKFKGDYYAIDRQTAQDVRATTYASLGYPAAWYYDLRVIAAVEAAAQNTNGHKIPKLPGVQGNIAATYTTDLGPVSLRSGAKWSIGASSTAAFSMSRSTIRSLLHAGQSLYRVQAEQFDVHVLVYGHQRDRHSGRQQQVCGPLWLGHDQCRIYPTAPGLRHGQDEVLISTLRSVAEKARRDTPSRLF
jgi:outer membrane receptor protein involved in Fe transport